VWLETDIDLKMRKEKEDMIRISAEKIKKEQIEKLELVQYLKLKQKYDAKKYKTDDENGN
jgi:hypothetical protein